MLKTFNELMLLLHRLDFNDFFRWTARKKPVVANQWPVIVGSMLIAFHKLEIIQPKISI